MRYFSNSVMRDILPPFERIVDIVAETVAAMSREDVLMAPRPTLDSRCGARFIAFPALLETAGVAGVKWLGLPGITACGRGKRGGSLLVLSRLEDAEPFAILDAQWITAIRTCAVSFLAAQRLAVPGSYRMAFLACGEQARLHLHAFRKYFPIREIRAYSRRLSTAQAFARAAESEGLEAMACSSLKHCVEGAHIVISSTPAAAPESLRYEWLDRSSFCSLVDLGRSLDVDSIPEEALIVVDAMPQMHALVRDGKLKSFDGIAHVPLFDVLTGEGTLPSGARFLMPTGLGAADVGIAYESYVRSMPAGAGMALSG